jgi:PKD repeat protein
MIHTGQSVAFSSTVTGGSLPYSYQWYINDHPFPNATTWNWTYTPSSSGVYFVYLRVTDTDNTTAQSQTARVDVISTPVGGISISQEKPLPIASIATYIALVGLFGAVLSFTKRKRK